MTCVAEISNLHASKSANAYPHLISAEDAVLAFGLTQDPAEVMNVAPINLAMRREIFASG